MTRIVAVVGTPKAEGSATVSLISRFVDLVRERERDVELDVIGLGAVRVEPCRGCWTCSAGGACPIKDDLLSVQERILGADLVILGSPVFAMNISAQMKAFIDRSFPWAHTMRLLGKPSLTAMTAAFSDMSGPESYLRSMAIALGTLPMGALRELPFAPVEGDPGAAFAARWGDLADRVALVLGRRSRPEPTPEHEHAFETMRSLAMSIPGGHAKSRWEANGWTNKTFAQALAMI